VRPSGTEPKLKCYLEVVAGDQRRAAEQLAALRAELTGVIGAPPDRFDSGFTTN
jgi:phosphomannomutase